jgi:hypothetical protein
VAHLGFDPDARVLIINCDDFGMCHAENLGTFDALLHGVATSATVMMPCSWVPEVVAWKKQHPEANLGVHLTLTAEWEHYRWRPLLGLTVPSLIDPTGYMWDDTDPLWAHVNEEQAYREARAQVELAIRLGLDPTHLDNHMGSLQLHPKLWRIYLRLAREFKLPLRLASAALYDALGAKGQRGEYDKVGILGPDNLIYPDAVLIPKPKTVEDLPAYYEKILRSLRPGTVTELYLHVGIDGPEFEAICGSHGWRQADHDWLVSPATRKLLDDLGIKLISYRPLRDLQRKSAIH